MQTRVSVNREEQIDKLKEIGSLLQKSRQEKSISLEEVAAKTQIRLYLLKAIESGQLDSLPEPVYTRGLIKKFGDTLGLNGEEISSNLPLSSVPKLLTPSWVSLKPPQVKPIHLYLLYILLVIGSVNYISSLLDKNTFETSGEIASKPLDKNLVSTSNKNSIAVSSVDPNSNDRNETSDQSLRVGIALKSASWIRVVADGKTQFEGVLESGQQRTWIAKQQLTIVAKNAGGVMVALNDREAKQLGQPGQPKQVTFGNKDKPKSSDRKPT